MSVGFLIGGLGGLLLAHAAYATVQYRGMLKIVEEEFSGPPINVVLELILGLAFCMWAALTVPGKFLSILPDSEENRMIQGNCTALLWAASHTLPALSFGILVKEGKLRANV
ncbi:membrane magnesium transporter isoform X1 [Magnolia sinica]|uniref:membrane magnesium transporter isoform X1 n=1 Tax=Magnolia sinica TaxID=86752 RepID=UPI00265917B5|nr:membrane magnesium transporter isoform X1 [Magnolia sinica]